MARGVEREHLVTGPRIPNAVEVLQASQPHATACMERYAAAYLVSVTGLYTSRRLPGSSTARMA